MNPRSQPESLNEILRELKAEQAAEAAWSQEEPQLLSQRELRMLQRMSQSQRAPWPRRLLQALTRPSSWRGWAALGAAAAVMLWLLLRQPSEPALAPYVVKAAKTATPRSAEGVAVLSRPADKFESTQELRLSARDMLTIVLWPREDQPGPIAVRSFVRRAGQLELFAATPEPWPDGSFRLHQPVDRLALQPEQELVFFVGRPRALPSLEQARQGFQPEPRSCQQLNLRVLIEP